jgi:hypothetical protein
MLAWRVGGPHNLYEKVKKKNSCSFQNKTWLQDLPILEKTLFWNDYQKISRQTHHITKC